MNNETEKAVLAMQRYIRQHISEKISLADLAHAAGYSPWHADRMFKELTGRNAFDYIRSLRLTQAAQRLRDTKDKVVDVAFDFVFDSHEGFTRAFAREFDITPKAYQTAPIPIQYFIPYDIVVDKRKKGEKDMNTILKPVFIQIVERPKRKAIVKRGQKAKDYFAYCEEVGCDIWGVFTSVKEAISEPVGMWLSPKLQKPGTSLYIQGVEVPYDYKGIVPEGCELIELPATRVMMFQGEPYDDNDFEKEVCEVMDYVAKYNPKALGYEYDEDGYRFQNEPRGYRGYIEGRTVKAINK